MAGVKASMHIDGWMGLSVEVDIIGCRQMLLLYCLKIVGNYVMILFPLISTGREKQVKIET